MAFNRETFKTRALTAVLFVIVMAAGVLINKWGFFILFSVIHFGCWMEYQRLVGLIDPGYKEITPFHKWGVMLAGWCILLYFSSDTFNIFGFRMNELGWWLGLIFLFILLIVELLFEDHIRLKNFAHSAFGLMYISLSIGLMMSLYGIFLPIVLIGTIWINDTMAYIVGSLIGRTPLSKISPKKTWEGTIGGIILASGLAGWLAWVGDEKFKWDQPLWFWISFAAIAAITGTFGDLLESKLKRLAGVKDSGTLMPGHGGFLDRFDSLLVATPCVWIFVKIFLG